MQAIQCSVCRTTICSSQQPFSFIIVDMHEEGLWVVYTSRRFAACTLMRNVCKVVCVESSGTQQHRHELELSTIIHKPHTTLTLLMYTIWTAAAAIYFNTQSKVYASTLIRSTALAISVRFPWSPNSVAWYWYRTPCSPGPTTKLAPSWSPSPAASPEKPWE